ncbi:MAG: hypothetical protein PF961_10255 [Planctomycetota bacterium]|jgi:hypothetical protein|nr:hypothetical protein [Planctomycetota bacterium]
MQRSGFTLFEVAISLLIVSMTVLGVVLILPIGIKAQQQARHEIYASAATMTLLDNAHNPVLATGTYPGYSSFHSDTAIDMSYPVASGLRDARVYSSAMGPDLEHLITAPDMGATPVPTVIARRLDSDGDEIGRHLDAGGQLFYLNPTSTRHLGNSSNYGNIMRVTPPQEMQELVFAVIGNPQQNLLIAHPLDNQPRYETYPFPPATVSAGSDRNGARYAFRFEDTIFGDITATHHVSLTNGSTQVDLGVTAPDILTLQWPGWASRAFLRVNGSDYPVASRNSATRLILDDPVAEPSGSYLSWELILAANPDERIQVTLPGYYTTATATCPANSSVGDFDFNPKNGDPNRADGTDRLLDLNYNSNAVYRHRARNWVHFASADPGSPWALGFNKWIDLAADFRSGYLPIAGILRAGQMKRKNATSLERGDLPAFRYRLPTYEMRANYRDRAIALWQAVMPANSGLPSLTPSLSTLTDDLRSDCDRYEYPPSALASFPGVNPQSLAASDFPPHPAQVLALSYLAHAAMMCAGYRPPFSNGAKNELFWDSTSRGTDTNGDGWDDDFEYGVSNAYLKDAKVITGIPGTNPAGFSATTVTITSDAHTDLVLYAGDYLWLEKVPDYVFEVKVTNINGMISVAAGGATATVELLAAYPVLGRGNGLRYGPAEAVNIQVDPSGYAMRVANATDLAFAATAHEMSLRWAMCYGRERPYDWGAPRPANRASSLDRPLAMYDLFPSGNALRPETSSDSNFFTVSEIFYRFLSPVNAGASEVSASLRYPSSAIANTHSISHVTLNGRKLNELNTVTGHTRLQATSATDSARFWPARPFDQRDRGREIVFWAVAWQDYQDAESAPGAERDIASLGWTVGDDNNNRLIMTPRAGGKYRNDPWLYGHPEQRYGWQDANRRSWGYASGDGSSTTDLDRMGIHFGADRNNNTLLDVGSITPATRLRARQVSRITVYDPILRLHARN